MATWTTIPDSSLEPGKPIRSIDTLALRDNPVAIAEGQSGAPKIEDVALSSSATAVGQLWVNSRLRVEDVLHRNSLASVGAVGTYAFLGETSFTTTEAGATRAGSSLRYAGIAGSATFASATSNAVAVGSSATPAGTWRAMGRALASSIAETNIYPATLWLRIS